MLDTVLELLHRLRDVEGLVATAGLVGITLIILAETGLLVFFLPGDSLLVTAGLLIASGRVPLDIWLLGLCCSVAAVLGDTISYSIGRRLGAALFTREDSLLFNRKHLRAAHDFYETHGGKTIIIARFMPIVRTFAPVVAGAGTMSYPRFLSYNVIGGLSWIWSMLLLGYGLAQTVPGVAKHVEKIIILIVLLSILPGIIAWWRERRAPRAG